MARTRPTRHVSEAARPAPPVDTAALLERISDGFVAFDRDFRYVVVSRRAGELLGRDPAELIGRSYYEAWPKAIGTPFERAYARAMADQVPIVIEDHYAPWDRWFENRIYPTGDGIAILFTDITERKQAEARLRLQADLLARVPEAIIAVDADQRIEYWGPAAAETYGWTAEETVGRPVGEVLASEISLEERQLPRCDGFEVLARLRAQPTIGRLPVVVLTSSREDADVERAYALGANSYLVKPGTPEAFMHVVKSLGLYWLVVNEPPRFVL